MLKWSSTSLFQHTFMSLGPAGLFFEDISLFQSPPGPLNQCANSIFQTIAILDFKFPRYNQLLNFLKYLPFHFNRSLCLSDFPFVGKNFPLSKLNVDNKVTLGSACTICHFDSNLFIRYQKTT